MTAGKTSWRPEFSLFAQPRQVALPDAGGEASIVEETLTWIERKLDDPVSFIGVALLAFVALAATLVPTRAAMKVEPVVALRYE